MLIGNLAQLAGLVVGWLVEHDARPGDPETAFWGEVLKRYWAIGAVAYYVFGGRTVSGRPSVEDTVWSRFVRAPWSVALLRLNRVWYPAFVAGALGSGVIGLLQIDILVRPWTALVGVTAATGLALTSAILFVALGDAAIRAAGSGDDRLIANEIVSSFWAPRNVDGYAEATTADTTPP